MTREATLDSVVESQAELILVKNKKIEDLAAQLSESKARCEGLQQKIDSHDFQLLIDELEDRMSRDVEQRLRKLGVDFEGELATVNEGDVVRLDRSGRTASVAVVMVTELLTYSMTPHATPELLSTIDSMARAAVEQIARLETKEIVFYRFPRMLSGIGALFGQGQTSAIGAQLIVSYDPTSLGQRFAFRLALVDATRREEI